MGALDGGESGVDLEHLAHRHQSLHLSVLADFVAPEAAMGGGLNQSTDFDFVRGYCQNLGQIWVQAIPQALQRRVDSKGRTDLVNALRSVGAIPISVNAAELVAIQTATLG